MARRKRGSPEALRDLLSKVYPSRDPADLRAIRAFGFWDRVLPSRVTQNARPVRLRDGVMFIHVTTSTWAQELSLLKEQLLARIRLGVPELGISDMHIRVGPLPERPLTRRERPTQSRPALRPVELPEELARALAHVDDNELRDAITQAATTSLAVPEPPPKRKNRVIP